MSYQSMMLDSMNDGMHEQNIIKTKSKNVLLFGATQATPDQRSPLTPDKNKEERSVAGTARGFNTNFGTESFSYQLPPI